MLVKCEESFATKDGIDLYAYGETFNNEQHEKE